MCASFCTFYDVRFIVLTPTAERIKLIINVEGQKKFDPGYDIVTRGIFYCAGMLSAQKNTEFTGSDYNAIKKVYSIWISTDNPVYVQHTITSYRLTEHPLYGMLPKQMRKENIIYHNYGIETTVKPEGGLREMCNLSDLIEERGIEKGDRMRLLTLIQKKLARGKSLEQIADELEETVEAILPLYEQVLQEANQG